MNLCFPNFSDIDETNDLIDAHIVFLYTYIMYLHAVVYYIIVTASYLVTFVHNITC
jgi:hypothetical protein